MLAIATTTKDDLMLARCATFYAKDQNGIARAAELIEAVLRNDPFNPQTNSKAINIYIKANQLDKTLHCAEIAADLWVDCYLQILTLKIKLGHSPDLEEFFSTGLLHFQQIDEIRHLHIYAFIHHTSLTNHFERAIWHFKKVLDSEPAEEFFVYFNPVINSMIHAGEAAYRVIRFVMSGDKSYTDDEYSQENDDELFVGFKERIEERFDVGTFGSQRLTPKEYLEWFKTRKDPNNKPNRFMHSHTQKPEYQKFPGQKTNTRSESNMVNQFGYTAGRTENNGNRSETTDKFNNAASNSRVSIHQDPSVSRCWRSRQFSSNTLNANSHHSNPVENSRSHDGGTSSITNGTWRTGTRNTGEPRNKFFASNWRARDTT